MERIVRLKPIIEDKNDYYPIEVKILELFKKDFFYQLFTLLGTDKKIINSSDDVIHRALLSGRITYSDGVFAGKFSSLISKKLREIGAQWDEKTSTFKIKLEDLPLPIRSSISLSKTQFDELLLKLSKRLVDFNVDDFVDKLNIAKYFDKVLFKTEEKFEDSVKNITIVPKLSKLEREKIATDWQTNMKLDIKKFTEEQILDLRKIVYDNVFVHGNRKEALVTEIKARYGVTENKAKFWARQETNLLMAKYKETKYVEAGVPEYEWGCVHMPHQLTPTAIYKPGEVRYSHGILQGKIFSWKDPPVTTPPGQVQRRNNPGQDYNCRCFAIPIVRFKK